MMEYEMFEEKDIAHIILTTDEIVRIEKGLQKFGAEAIYIIYAKDSKLEEEKFNEIKKETIKLLRKMGFLEKDEEENEKVIVKEIDFYNLSSAIIDLYELFYEEASKGRLIKVNASGGTRIVAFAATIVSMLIDNVDVFYYVPIKYDKKTRKCIEVDKKIFHIKSPFDFKKVIPRKEKIKTLILGLSDGEERTIGQILKERELIKDLDHKDDKYDENKKARKKTISNYFYWVSKQDMKDIINIMDRKLKLTPVGHLLAKIFQIERKVDNKD